MESCSSRAQKHGLGPAGCRWGKAREYAHSPDDVTWGSAQFCFLPRTSRAAGTPEVECLHLLHSGYLGFKQSSENLVSLRRESRLKDDPTLAATEAQAGTVTPAVGGKRNHQTL